MRVGEEGSTNQNESLKKASFRRGRICSSVKISKRNNKMEDVETDLSQ